MNAYNSVFKSNSNFVSRKSIVFHPIFCIIQQVSQICLYLPFIYTNVLISSSKLSCPRPYITIHSILYSSYKVFCQEQVWLSSHFQGPQNCPLNILLLKFIQFTACSDGRDQQSFFFIIIQWCLSFTVFQV